VDVVLSCSYMVDEVRRVMGDGADWGVRLRYAVEPEPLGTGGGVRNAVDLVGGLVAVLNGDVLTDADLGAMLRFHADRRARATIYLVPVPDPTPYGLVELAADGRVLRFVEKPDPAQVTTNTINAGIYLIDRDLLKRIDPGRAVSIEREFFPGLLADGVPFFGWVPDHYWIDIGSPAKYRQAQLDLMANKVAARLAPAPWPAGGGEAVEAAPTATVMHPSVIGAGTRLGPDCRVGPGTVLGEGCTVGANAVVEGAILWTRVEVAPGAVLRDCIVATGARIGRGAVVEPGAVVAAGDAVAAGARRSA
jgi:mannose-1-phosphate guanylyltransferase